MLKNSTLKKHFFKPGLNKDTMINFTCLLQKHMGLWSIASDSFVPAYPSIRGTIENQRGSPGR